MPISCCLSFDFRRESSAILIKKTVKNEPLLLCIFMNRHQLESRRTLLASIDSLLNAAWNTYLLLDPDPENISSGSTI